MPKRKSDVVVDISSDDDEPSTSNKKARKSNQSDVSASTSTAPKLTKAQKAKEDAKKEELEELEEDEEIAIYDDCNEIRRKIRAIQKEPNFKITHWLREIGGVNSNSFGRFMKASTPSGGAENGTYEAAYVYFEKRRIKEGKKKTAKRLRNEQEHPYGFGRRDMSNRKVWVFGP